MKKVIAIIMSVIMILGTSVSVFADTASADDDYVYWDGNEDTSKSDGFVKVSDTSYEIHTPSGFLHFLRTISDGKTYKGCTVRLKKDLCMKAENGYRAFANALYDIIYVENTNVVFTHKDIEMVFEGTFDGENHKVSELSITPNGSMFGKIKNATFKNFTIGGIYRYQVSNVVDPHDWGVIASCAYGNCTLSNIKFIKEDGKYFDAPRNFGTFVGHVAEGASLKIDNCESDLIIHAYSDNIGGFVGLVDSNAYLSVTNSKYTGGITNGRYLGGIVGAVYGSVYLGGVENDGNIKASAGEAGGLIGILDWDRSQKLGTTSIENCINKGNVTAVLGAGGIVGWVGNDSNDQNYKMTKCKNYGAITSSSSEAGGIIGHLDTDGCGQSFWDNENYGTIYGYKNAGGIIGYSEAGGEFVGCKNEATVTSKTKNAGGVIGATEDDANRFNSCTNSNKITACENAGGIAGYVGDDSNDPNFDFAYCKNSGYIYSEYGIAGGIVGYIDSDGCEQLFMNDENSGSVGGQTDAGGIIGYTEGGGKMTSCWNGAYVGSNNKAGGLIGEVEDDNWNISDCSNTATVCGKNHTGGIAGDLGEDDDDPTFTIEQCSNSGWIISLESDAGGIVGLLDTDSDSNKLQYNTNTGNVNASRMAGGICGYTLGDADFYGCKSEADINSFGDAGCHAAGILGDSENSFNVSNLIKSCTVHGTISSSSGSAHKLYGPNGKDTNSLTASTFANGNVWMVVSLAEILVFGIVIVVLAAKLRKKKTNI